MSKQTDRQRIVVLLVLCLGALATLALPLGIASCATQRQAPPGEPAALERLRAQTRRAALPAEADAARIETEYHDTRAGALARMVRARGKLAAGDMIGAAALLADNTFARHTAIADYALLLRAQALAQAGRAVEARATYEELARVYPDSLRAREATLRAAEVALQNGQAAAVPTLVKSLSAADDPAALLLTAKAYEQQGDVSRARAAYRRSAFYAPVPPTDTPLVTFQTITPAPPADIMTVPPPSGAELTARAELLYQARRYAEAADAYKQLFAAAPAIATPELRLHAGIAAFKLGRTAEAVAALTAVPTTAGATRAEALYYLAQTQARAKQWPQARATADELRRAFPQDTRGVRALVAAGLSARDAKFVLEANNFFRAAVSAAPNTAETAQAQFELAWAAHDARNFQASGPLLLEHLANYADKNTDNRGRAGYWAGRDLERAGRVAEARAIYRALQQRYEANWYGVLAQRRLDALPAAPAAPANDATAALVARASANLDTVTVAAETAGPAADVFLRRADELDAVGLSDFALDELNQPLAAAPNSPRLNLAKARIYRSRDDNLQALLTMQKAYPDYSQMKPAELTGAEWDAVYPLAHWPTIKQEARAHNIDPYTVAGLIRQESIFDPRARSQANAFGLMQLLLETAQRTARKYNLPAPAGPDALYEPTLNIKLGTAYLRDQLDRFGRIEYVAAAYNAGPARAQRWLTELPSELDEWAEAVPFKETRGYVQGVVRNTMQYRRLYDEQGNFRPEVGRRAVRPPTSNAAPAAADTTARPRRVSPAADEPPQEQER